MISNFLSNRRTKIIATLGPSSCDYNIIKKLCLAGVNVFRLNFSHGSHEDHKKNASIIRDVEKELSTYLSIMMDLQGPKIRIGVFEDGEVALKTGSKFILDLEKEFGNSRRVSLPHPEIFHSLKEGVDLLLDDGKIRLQVMSNDGNHIETKVVVGGMISNRKGVNIPNAILPINSLTEKDKNDIKLIDELGIDWVAVSFVQTSDDIIYARSLMKSDIKIISKIEKPSAVENIDKIIDVSDAIMIARGDLGVEIPLETIPGIQYKIVRACHLKKCPVIVATQMLESMRENVVPTRAEVLDVSNAVYQGVDAVMLSAESASGKYPVESVDMMRRIIISAENDIKSKNVDMIIKSCGISKDMGDSISESLSYIVDVKNIDIIAAFTESGRTALDISSFKTSSNIIAMTTNIKSARRMSLYYGVNSVIVDDIYTFSQMIQIAKQKILEIEFDEGINRENFAIIAGVPFRESGSTNILHICNINSNIENNF